MLPSPQRLGSFSMFTRKQEKNSEKETRLSKECCNFAAQKQSFGYD